MDTLNNVRTETINDILDECIASPHFDSYTKQQANADLRLCISRQIHKNICEIAEFLIEDLKEMAQNLKITAAINIDMKTSCGSTYGKIKLIEGVFETQDIPLVAKRLLTQWGYKFEVTYIDDVAHAEVTI